MFSRPAAPSSTSAWVTRSAILRFCSALRPSTQVICTCGMGPPSTLPALGAHGGEHCPHPLHAARGAALAPLLVALGGRFQVLEHLRIVELLAPGAQHRLNAHPNTVLLARGLEEEFFVQQGVGAQGA